jgi:hypothetical protein
MKGAAKLISRVPLWPVVGTAFGVVVPFHVLAPPLYGVAVKTQFGPAHPVLAALVLTFSVTSDGAVTEWESPQAGSPTAAITMNPRKTFLIGVLPWSCRDLAVPRSFCRGLVLLVRAHWTAACGGMRDFRRSTRLDRLESIKAAKRSAGRELLVY